MKRRSFLKSACTMTLAAPAILTDVSAAPAKTTAKSPRLDITWLGGATMLIECGDLTLLTDPAFGEGDEAFRMGDPNKMFDLAKGPDVVTHKRLTPFRGVDLSRVDQVLLSHLHEDHFDQKAESAIATDMPFLVPSHDRERLAANGFTQVHVADWMKPHVITRGDVTLTLTALPAEHSENPEIASLLGPGNGYWLEIRQGDWTKSVYWTGDTFPTSNVLDALEGFGSPDVFIPHLGGVGTSGSLGQISMGAGHAAIFVDRLRPGKVLPVHHSTYALYLEPVSSLPAVLAGKTHGLDLVSEGTCASYV
jgi:L-ascorbate metabolism protein UlaG (beta-lactamase superfamily)